MFLCVLCLSQKGMVIKMKHMHFDVEKNGFYGAYWQCKTPAKAAIIAMLGDDPEDYMARSCVRWLLKK